MSNEIDHNDLANQLSSFSISTQEERLTQQLGQTHITSSSNSIFSIPPHLQQPIVNNNNTTPVVHPNTESWENKPQWDTTNTNEGQEEGWGDGPPSYTSISQGTYFGFNSIMEAPKLANQSVQNSSSPSANQAFGRFKSTPVTFTSAAAAYNNNNNNSANKS